MTLPRLLAELAELAGSEAALKLAAAKGGTRLYVPKSLDKDHPLAKDMGLEGARSLCRLYGGEYITVPMAHARGLKAMQAKADEMLKSGRSANEVALETGLHLRCIYDRRAKLLKRNSSQPDLFDKTG